MPLLNRSDTGGAFSPAGLHQARQALKEAHVLLLLEVVEHFLQEIQKPHGH